jgi:hypothetical protein
MIHASYACPKVIPWGGTGAWSEIDRVQELSGSIALNREKIREVGRDGTVAWRKRIPTTNVTIRQFEYGNLEFWNKLGNKTDATTAVTEADFKTSMVDVLCYKTDDSGTFLGTHWYPKLRTSGFSVNVGDPQAMVERSFTLVGEDEISTQGNSKYIIYKTFSAAAGTNAFNISPDATIDPDASGAASGYIIRVVRVTSGGVSTELTYTTNYTYVSATHTLTVTGCAAGDTVKVWYYCDEYLSGASIFTNNDTDAGALTADSASIYLWVAADNYVYRLQSVGIDVSFDRADYYEIGSNQIVQRGVNDKTVRVTLGRILEAYTVEEVLRGVPTNYGKFDPRKFGSAITLRVKFYSTDTKGTFKIGYKCTNLSPVSIDGAIPVNQYITRNTVLEGETFTVSNLEATINA